MVFSPEQKMARYYRIVQEPWAATAMDGEGARRFGGRWNPPGVPAVYLAASRALAALEILVHAPREALLLDWKILEVEIPDEWVEECIPSTLPRTWREQPSSPAARDFGRRWLATGHGLALRVPSVIIPEEFSILLNINHSRMRDLQVGEARAFSFDPRLSV